MATGTCQKCHAALGEGAKFCPNCSAMVEQVADDAEDKLLGKIVAGRYRIVKMLGEGGMGRVYLAEQQMGATTRKVAIKTLHQELSGDPQLVARFYRECETVIELSHPNTIQFYDFGKFDDGTLYIVMEFIQGSALAHVLEESQGKGLPVARCDKILIQVCGSLHEAHGHGIVHRDLKPDNVLLTNRGGQTDFVKVLDFGIAKRSDAEDEKKGKLTQQGMVLGTPPYMSPEQFGGQALDARSDIYSLGIMVYEMLTGRLPFEAKTPWEWATKHLTAQPESLDTNPAAAHVPPAKRAAVMKALQKNRDHRQATVLEFLQEFTGYQDAQAAWTMATSAGGAIIPKGGEAQQGGTASTPVQTPTPMPQPVYGTGGMGAQMPTPAPGYTTGGAHAYNGGGYGYTTGSQPQRTSGGGGAGKIIAAIVVMLFVVGGGTLGGAAWWMSRDTNPTPTVPVALVQPPGIPPNLNVGGTNIVLPGTNPVLPGTNPLAVPPTINNGGTQPSTVLQPATDVGMRPIDPGTNVIPPNNGQPNNGQPNGGTNAAPNGNPPNGGNPDGPDRGPSAADEAGARRLLTSGDTSLAQNDVASAITALSQAQRLAGRRYAGAVALRTGIERKGSNMVGNLLQRGDCPGAQALFRQLRTVGADGASRQHFSPDWCPRP
jgi:serine/threonine-protein kinase